MSGREEARWRPAASRLALETRARLLADIRAFFAARNVLEVETPILSRAGNTDPNIRSLRTDSPRSRYLRTSPEHPMKRLLAAGHSDLYELGRVFRAGESGPWHNPEFTLLEWYRLGWSYLDLADEVVALLKSCGRGCFDAWPCERVSYRQLFLRQAGIDPFLAGESECQDAALERGIEAGPMDLRDWLDLLLSHLIQPALGGERITVVCDFPCDQAALARVRPEATPLAERFEVYLGAVELANGYQELRDSDELRRRFEHDNRQRMARGDEPMPVDEALLEALRHGLPDCAGVALGVDRLLMAMLGLEHIDMAIAFPADRA
jgi:lysyl-tRNA synthetase class 2